VAIPIVLNGAIGARLHIPFSVVVRSGFGYYFAYFCIVSRSILAMFWLGIQSANGAICMTVMLSALWPSFQNIPNSLAADAGIDTKGMISYFLFWLIQLPLLLIPPTRLKWLFIIKLIAAPIASLATMGYLLHKAGGSGELFNLPERVSGETRAYLWLSSMSSVTGTWATLAVNIPDFSRYARSSEGQYVQFPMLPLLYTLVGTVGIITTSAGFVVYGSYIWNPLEIFAIWNTQGSGGRAAAFFCALSWYIAQVGTNITANSISAANDLTVLFPRYINIKRGCVIAAVIGGWVIVPWKIISSAETFLAFMGGYACFLGPIAGIILADYWLVKRQNIDVPALYDPHGRYRYRGGVNWRAVVAMLISTVPHLPGLAYSISPSTTFIDDGSKHLFTFDWLYGFFSSILVYTLMSLIWPAKESLLPRTIFGLPGLEPEEWSGDDEKRSEDVGVKGGGEVETRVNKGDVRVLGEKRYE
jgi:NCS1 family nucleobase:cation symporter-1